MSEAIALQILQLLIVAFPPFAALLAKYLPDEDDDPLAVKVRELLPVEGASTKARRKLEAAAAATTADPSDPDDLD